jgi:hypothetical protein
MRSAVAIPLTKAERATPTKWSRGRRTPARVVPRARIVPRAADRRENQDLAAERHALVDPHDGGGGRDQPGDRAADLAGQRPPIASHEDVHGLERSPVRRAAGRRRRSGSRPARACAGAVVRREVPDSSPGSHATEPAAVLRPLADHDHDSKRNGTTTLFAVISMADGLVLSQRQPRHRHQEWLKFLKRIDAQTPPEPDLHLVVDNVAMHKHPKVLAWQRPVDGTEGASVTTGRVRSGKFVMTGATAVSARLEEHFADLTDPRSREGTDPLINEVRLR